MNGLVNKKEQREGRKLLDTHRIKEKGFAANKIIQKSFRELFFSIDNKKVSSSINKKTKNI